MSDGGRGPPSGKKEGRGKGDKGEVEKSGWCLRYIPERWAPPAPAGAGRECASHRGSTSYQGGNVMEEGGSRVQHPQSHHTTSSLDGHWSRDGRLFEAKPKSF